MVIEITRKKAIALLALIFIFVGIGVTVYLSQQNQDTRSRASEDSPETTVVATVNGEDITKAQVREIAEEQFAPEAVNQEVLKDAMDVLIERMILDDTAQSQSINVDTTQVENRMSSFDLEQNEAYYDVLRDEVILKNVKSRKAQSIGFWAPIEADQVNLEPEDKTTAVAQIAAGKNALPEIERSMNSASAAPASIVNSISSKYAVLSPSITLNGYRVSEADEAEISGISAYKIYEFSDSNLDPSVLDGLFAMEIGDVTLFSSTETNAGGVVFKLIDKGNDSGLSTYEEWLNGKINADVVLKGAL